MKNLLAYLSLLGLLIPALEAQRWIATEKQPMPMRVSNNAVTAATINGVVYVYSFGGIDSTKTAAGISRRAFRYAVAQDSWDTIAPLPDTLGKIASAASTVKNKVYIIGGYHVMSNGSEVSSNRVHIYDPQTNAYAPDGQNIPTRIDDQVQCVWRDSLIFVVTGWSNTTNLPLVQIYNPSTDTWASGTSTPNTVVYKAFGAAGTIVGDTLYYYGGASTGGNFPAQSHLRKGYINPSNPLLISWSNATIFAGIPGYRMAATSDSMGNVHFLGGSRVSYNYDGIAYNGSGGVNPSNNQLSYAPIGGTWMRDNTQVLPMDLRGIADESPTRKFLVGGMENGQWVSNKTIELNFSNSVDIDDGLAATSLKLYPNPSDGRLRVRVMVDDWTSIDVVDALGKTVARQNHVSFAGDPADGATLDFDLTALPSGAYCLRMYAGQGVESCRFILR
jgi:hypothetical protein